MKKFITKVLIKLLNTKLFKEAVIEQTKYESMAFDWYVDGLASRGFPKNPNGTSMSTWELYEYYLYQSGKRETYLRHAQFMDPRKRNATSNTDSIKTTKGVTCSYKPRK